MTTEYVLCEDCACGVCNDDWTHLDFYHDDPECADNAQALIEANLECMGWLTHVGPADEPGYFTCAVCWEIQCGGGERFHGEA